MTLVLFTIVSPGSTNRLAKSQLLQWHLHDSETRKTPDSGRTRMFCKTSIFPQRQERPPGATRVVRIFVPSAAHVWEAGVLQEKIRRMLHSTWSWLFSCPCRWDVNLDNLGPKSEPLERDVLHIAKPARARRDGKGFRRSDNAPLKYYFLWLPKSL